MCFENLGQEKKSQFRFLLIRRPKLLMPMNALIYNLYVPLIKTIFLMLRIVYMLTDNP